MRLYSWLSKGKDDYLINQTRRNSLHVIAAVTDEQLITFIVLTNTIRGDDFQAFIPGVVDKMNELYGNKGKTYVLFYDNAPVHRTKEVVKEVKW